MIGLRGTLQLTNYNSENAKAAKNLPAIRKSRFSDRRSSRAITGRCRWSFRRVSLILAQRAQQLAHFPLNLQNVGKGFVGFQNNRRFLALDPLGDVADGVSADLH